MQTIDLTPTWPEAANILLMVLENGNETGKANARKEIRRMAQILQSMIDESKAEKESAA